MPLNLADGVTVEIGPPQMPTTVIVPVPGLPGPPGAPGGGGYTHTQTIPQAVWTVTHNLGRYPAAWSLYDNAGRLCDNFLVQHTDLNSCLVSMDVATAGLIRLI